MNIAFLHPWALCGLLLGLLPLFNNGVTVHSYPTLSFLPGDPLSVFLSAMIKLLAVAAIASLVLGLSGIHRTEQWIEKVGFGANIVMLFDRSSSMDQTFAGHTPGGGDESKSGAARRLLLDFIARRPKDRIGVVGYSTSPLLAMPLTENKQAVSAAVSATDTPALAYTNISKGLAMALSFYRERNSRHGANIILLISDGAAAIDADNERKLRQWFASRSVSLYWIFLRGRNTPGVFDRPEDPRDDNAQSRPERYLHLFFQSLKIPYRVFQAESPEEMQQAVAEIDRQETMPLHYRERTPRQDLSGPCYAIATLLTVLLLGIKVAEARL